MLIISSHTLSHPVPVTPSQAGLTGWHYCCNDPRWIGYNPAPGEPPIIFWCQACEKYMVRDWVKDGSRKRGGPDMLWAIPSGPFPRGALPFGGDWISGWCVMAALGHPSYSTRTFNRTSSQSASRSILGGDHSMPVVTAGHFVERWTSLANGSVPDVTWDKEKKGAFVDWWCSSLPEDEVAYFRIYSPDYPLPVQCGQARGPMFP